MQLTRSGESRLYICCTRIHSLGLSETIGTQEDPLIKTACRHWLRGNLRPLQAATAPESCDSLAFAKLVPAERRIQSSGSQCHIMYSLRGLARGERASASVKNSHLTIVE